MQLLIEGGYYCVNPGECICNTYVCTWMQAHMLYVCMYIVLDTAHHSYYSRVALISLHAHNYSRAATIQCGLIR